jgi:THO complex subunit 5
MSSACGDPFSSLRAAAASVAGAVSTADVRAAAAHGSLAVLDLKARNREVYEGLELRRQGTADAKHALEKTNLQLQNLQYEKSHYAKEIQMCRDFRSAFADSDVGLVAEEEFLRRAPPELNPGAANTGGDSHASHQRMLNRLAFELAGARRERRRRSGGARLARPRVVGGRAPL